MKFIRNLILLSVASFAFAVFNIYAATDNYIEFSIGGLSGHTTGVKKKYLSNQTTQKMETLRADHKIKATLYGVVSGATELVDTLIIEKRNAETFLKQDFNSNSKPFGDYKLNLKKHSIFGTTRYWGTWIYDYF